MQSVEQFMRLYFRERLKLRRSWVEYSKDFRKRFYTKDRSARFRRSEDEVRSEEKTIPEVVLKTEASGELTGVITTEPLGKTQQRFRYLLQPSDENWLIHHKEWQCFLCNGTGKCGSHSCQDCDGAGWKDYGPTAV